MKRLARILSFAAGVATIIWAMRDRFISLALPREPQPPAFRHPDDHPDVPHHPHPEPEPPRISANDDLQAINGIGPVFAAKLAAIDIQSFTDLAKASSSGIAEQLETSESRTADWINQAKKKTQTKA